MWPMLDNQLIALILQVLNAGSTSAGAAGLLIKQAYQPTNQGANSAPTAYLHKLFDERIGSPYRSDKWDAVHSVMVHMETEQYGTHFQLSSLATQSPSDVNSLTASDILNSCAYILQSDSAIQAFQAVGVGIQRITNVTNTPFLDDKNRWEYQPSFDFIMTHKQTITTTTPILERVVTGIYPV